MSLLSPGRTFAYISAPDDEAPFLRDSFGAEVCPFAMAIVVKADFDFPLFVGLYVRIPIERASEIGFSRKFIAIVYMVEFFRHGIAVIVGLPYACPVLAVQVVFI